MNLKCLCCGEPVSPKDVKLHYRVFVCKSCNDLADEFSTEVLGDVRRLQASIVQTIRHGLITGAMRDAKKHSEDFRSRLRFLMVLVDGLELECRSHYQTHQLSSGETTKQLVSADGKRNSPTTDLPD